MGLMGIFPYSTGPLVKAHDVGGELALEKPGLVVGLARLEFVWSGVGLTTPGGLAFPAGFVPSVGGTVGSLGIICVLELASYVS